MSKIASFKRREQRFLTAHLGFRRDERRFRATQTTLNEERKLDKWVKNFVGRILLAFFPGYQRAGILDELGAVMA